MRQPVRFAKPPGPVPADERLPARQHNFARSFSTGATLGFGCMVLGLSALTFWVTILGVDFTTELRAQETVASAPEFIEARVLPVARAEVILEPKTTERLPVFGGLAPSGQ